MFDWRKRVEILRAQNALRDGRLDEAFAIASGKEMRSWRACQVILEKLVDPLLDRAERHLSEDRIEEALADVERAREAGGNRPRISELRGQICARIDEREKERALRRDLLQSARRHLAQGSVNAGRALLQDVAGSDPEAVRLEREAGRREEKAREACARSELLLKEGALLEALAAAREVQASSPRFDGIPALLLKLKVAAVPSIERALAEGSLAAAGDLLGELGKTCGESLETGKLAEAMEFCREAARKIESCDYEGARSALARFRALAPRAAWTGTCEEALAQVSEGLQDLRSCPLWGFSRGRGRGPSPLGSTIRSSQEPSREEPLNGKPPADRFIIWVDGVGTFMVFRSNRVTLGRAGSSARPDLALTADLAGIQAEILRVDDDYFLLAHGPAEVNGRKVEKKLLEDGDRIRLSPKCELLFRIPSPLAPSAAIQLAGSRRIAGDVGEVVLMDRCLLLGSGEGCHIRAGRAPGRMILYAGDEGLTLRAEESILVDGKPQGKEAPVRMGSQVKVGEVTFTVTPL